MAYTYALSPSMPAIPTLYAAAHPEQPDKSPLGPIICRPATEEDVNEIASLADKVFRFNPVNLIRLPLTAITDEEHLKYYMIKFKATLARKCDRNFVAVSTNDGHVQGYLQWKQVGMGDSDDDDTTPPYMPPGSDVYLSEEYMSTINGWCAELRAEYGAYYLGVNLAVEAVIRNRGVASALCSLLATQARETGHPVFFITTYNAVPFYERWCLLNGYEVKMCGPPVYIDKARTCGHYLFRMVKATPPKPRTPSPKRWRGESP